ncbi:MAG: hypothetical protein WCB56_03500 [Terriglobales bacterium]
MTIQLRDCPLQHLAAARVCSGLQLLCEALAGKEQTVAFPVALLLVG